MVSDPGWLARSLLVLLSRTVLCWFVLLRLATVGLPSVAAQEVTLEKTKRADLHQAYQSHVFKSALVDGATLPFRMLVPQTIERGEKYPLVLFLHGAGERGVDNQAQLVHGASEFLQADRRAKYPAFVIFPQCPQEKRWVESDWNLKSGRGEFPLAPSVSMRLALEMVDHLCHEFPVDLDRCYVTGLSMGGQGAWYAAAAEPKRFAAMLEVCGGGDPSWADRYQGVPIWAFHGQDDNVVPVHRGREMVVALADAGHAPELRYVEYPGVKHNSWTRTFSRDDVYQWLFSQKRSQP